MVRTNDNKDVFERIAKGYIREDSHWGSDLDLIKVSLDELIKRESNPKWLDIGCGPAFHIASVGELYPEIEIVGIDYSPLMLDQARDRIGKLGLRNITLKESNVTEDFFYGKYGLITFLNNSFGNLYRNGTNPEEVRNKVIQKIANSLDKNGYFILSVYNRKKLDPNYGSNLRLLEELSNLESGDLFVEYSPKENGEVVYYSHWFSERELHEFAEKLELKLDFLERRMSRFLARYKK